MLSRDSSDLFADYGKPVIQLAGRQTTWLFHHPQRITFLILLNLSDHLSHFFSCYWDSACKHVVFPGDASHPSEAEICLAHSKHRKPQFNKQAALERLVCGTEVPSTLSNSTCLTTSLFLSNQLHAAFLLPHRLQIKEHPPLLKTNKQKTKTAKPFYNQGFHWGFCSDTI